MNTEQVWPENCWYAAAMSEEIADKPLGRTICGKPIVLYRESGRISALEDFCPHRGAPLSLGFIGNQEFNQGKLTCGYHGMVVNRDGSCHGMRGQNVDRLRGICSYPVVERYGFIWLWPGDAALADDKTIPDLFWANHGEWAYGGGYYLMKCDYRLLIDNLMDLTHETYVHSDSIGQPEIEESAPEVSRESGEVRVSRMMHNIAPPPFWQDALKANNANHKLPCDRWQICRFNAPGQVMIDVGVAHANCGGLDAAPNKRANGIVVDLITPETETSCHYFWGMARNFSANDPLVTDALIASQGKIFAEDQEILERQQANILHNPERRLMALNIDAGGVYSRKILEKMVKDEQAVKQC